MCRNFSVGQKNNLWKFQIILILKYVTILPEVIVSHAGGSHWRKSRAQGGEGKQIWGKSKEWEETGGRELTHVGAVQCTSAELHLSSLTTLLQEPEPSTLKRSRLLNLWQWGKQSEKGSRTQEGGEKEEHEGIPLQVMDIPPLLRGLYFSGYWIFQSIASFNIYFPMMSLFQTLNIMSRVEQ